MKYKNLKKIVLSLILVLMLLPIASIFSACGKSDGYNLNKLQKQYWEIATANNNVVKEDDKLKIDYPNHSQIISTISTNYPSLEKYNTVFENLTEFMSSYVDECSNNRVTNNVKLKNQIKKDLNLFSIAVRDVNEAFDMFAEFIYTNKSTPRAEECVERYENLIFLYERAYQTASNLSNDLSNLYYNFVLKDGNPDIYKRGSSDFESLVVTKFESRLKYQISNLTQCFVEMYIGGDFAHKVANNEKTFNLSENSYSASVTALRDNITSVEGAIEKAETNKAEFYELSVQAQNFQTALNNNQSKFVKAYNDVEYVLVQPKGNKTAYEELCVSIVEENYNLVMGYNSVLADMLDIISN